MVSQDRLSLNGIISGGQPINKTGAGQLVLAGANTFTGDLNVTVGTCILRHSTATGAIVAGTTVSAGASLQLENNISVGAEPLTLRGGAAVELENVSGTNSWGGAITLATSAVDIKSSRGTLSLGSTISGQNLIFDCGTGDIMANGTIGTGGAQTLTKYGSGNLILNGVCHFTGGATIEGGTVSFNGNSIVIGPVVVNNVGTKIAGTGTIPASSAVTMNDGTLLAPGGNNGDDAGTLTINGNLTFNFESTYIISVLPTGVDKLICGGNLVAAGNSPNVTISAPNGLTNFVSPTTIMTITGTYIKFDESAISSGFDMDDTKVGNNIRLIALQPIVPAFSGWGLFLFASLIASLSMYKIRLRRRAG